MRVPLNVLNLCQLCDPEVSRYSLGHVRFEQTATGPQAMANNGRVLACASWQDADPPEIDGPVYVPAQVCKTLLEAGRGRKVLILERDSLAGQTREGHELQVAWEASQEYRWPLHWQDIFSEAQPILNIRLRLELLRQLVDALSALTWMHSAVSVVLSVQQPPEPSTESSNREAVLFSADCDGELKVAGAIMSMAGGSELTGPLWIPPASPEAPKP